MATVAAPRTETPPRTEPAFANPWLWAGAGLALEAVCLGWLHLLAWLDLRGDSAPRIILVWFGLLLAGSAVAIRFQTPSAAAKAPSAMRLLLAGAFALLVLVSTGVWIASWYDLTPMRPGIATVLWFWVAPLCTVAAVQTFRRGVAEQPLTRLEEAAALLLTFALCCLIAQIALLESWYSLRDFLAVLTWVAVFAAPLSAVESRARRWAASAFLGFHFFGIITATLSISPNPWIFTQLAVRIYRPYLEFMYLGNAYHFYSPEPGPASHLWFRLYYEDADGTTKAHWFKIPKLDESGQPRHGTALIYQRMLSITENTTTTEPVAIEDPAFEKKLERRRLWSPLSPKKETVVGQESVPMEERIPFHPDLTPSQQFKKPNADTRRLLASYVRHVALKAQEERPDLRLVKVGLYRVVHIIPPAYLYMSGWDADDPAFFHSYFMGEYAADGTLRNPNDPFLYWMLPVLRDPPVTYFSKIRDWTRRHAGDSEWVCVIDEHGRRLWKSEEARFVE
jgi:hypothetical protein